MLESCCLNDIVCNTVKMVHIEKQYLLDFFIASIGTELSFCTSESNSSLPTSEMTSRNTYLILPHGKSTRQLTEAYLSCLTINHQTTLTIQWL